MTSVRQDWAHSETACPLLAELRPEVYGGWTPDVLARNLGALGVETKQLNRTVDGERTNRMGVELAQIETAIRNRAGRLVIDQPADPGPSTP